MENSLKSKIEFIKKDIENLIEAICSEMFFISWYGAYDINPKHLVFWICVKSDKLKHELTNDLDLNVQLRNLLDTHNYPQDVREEVFIGFESQETVDRESNGNWYHHFK